MGYILYIVPSEIQYLMLLSCTESNSMFWRDIWNNMTNSYVYFVLQPRLDKFYIIMLLPNAMKGSDVISTIG